MVRWLWRNRWNLLCSGRSKRPTTSTRLWKRAFPRHPSKIPFKVQLDVLRSVNWARIGCTFAPPQQDTLQSAAGRFTIGELGPHRMHFCAQTMRMFLRSILFGRGRNARKDNVPVCLRPSDAPAQMLAHNRKKSLPPLPPGARHQGDRVPSPEQSRSNVDRHGRQRTHAV